MNDDLLTVKEVESEDTSGVQRPRWKSLLRSGDEARRVDREQMFYPVWIDPSRRAVVRAGDYLPLPQEPDFDLKDGTLTAVWPVRSDGSLGRWGVGRETLNALASSGFVALGREDKRRRTWGLTYLSEQLRADLQSGLLEVVGRDEARNVADVAYTESASRKVKTVWHRSSHDAGAAGTDLLRSLLGARRSFPFPKALYAVEDALRIAVGDKHDAVVLDFFAGSGTTTHAVARLNAQDGGRRQSIIVTNNEVSDAEGEALRTAGHRPGDEPWEAVGIFNYITRPRLEAAITGVRSDGTPVPGTYLGGGPIAAGLAENVEFFEISYENPDQVSLGRAFEAISPLLWLKSGGRGVRIEVQAGDWAMPEGSHYAVLFETDQWRPFVDLVSANPDLQAVFIVTESLAAFQHIVGELPAGLATARLYEDYLRTFQINVEVP